MKGLRIKMHPAILAAALYFLMIGKIQFFFIAIVFVFLHELTHTAVSYMFGIKGADILITPIGNRALIYKLGELSFFGRLMVIISGPLFSIFVGLCIFMFAKKSETVLFAAWFNIITGIINLMPFLPLDGGNAMLLFFCPKIGAIKTACLMSRISTAAGAFIALSGFILMVLFPYEMGLLLFGIYIITVNKRSRTRLTCFFIKEMLNAGRGNRARPLKVKSFFVDGHKTIYDVLCLMDSESYHFFYYRQENIVKKLSQTEIMDAMLKEGIYVNLFSLGEA